MRLARKAALRQPFVAGLSSSAPGLFIKLQSPAERSMKKRRRMGEASLPAQSLILQRLAAERRLKRPKCFNMHPKAIRFLWPWGKPPTRTLPARSHLCFRYMDKRRASDCPCRGKGLIISGIRPYIGAAVRAVKREALFARSSLVPLGIRSFFYYNIKAPFPSVSALGAFSSHTGKTGRPGGCIPPLLGYACLGTPAAQADGESLAQQPGGKEGYCMQPFAILLLVGGGVAALALLFLILRTRRFYRQEGFVCPKCAHSFQPPLLQYLFSANALEGKILTCPNCGAKEYMEPQKKAEK